MPADEKKISKNPCNLCRSMKKLTCTCTGGGGSGGDSSDSLEGDSNSSEAISFLANEAPDFSLSNLLPNLSAQYAKFASYFVSHSSNYEKIKKDDDFDIELGDNNIELDTTQQDSLSYWQIFLKLAHVTINEENAHAFLIISGLTLMNIALTFITPYLLSETVSLYSSEEESAELLGANVEKEQLVMLLLVSYALSQLIPNISKQMTTSITMHNAEREVENICKHLLQKSLNYHVTTTSGEQNRLFQKGFSMSSVGTPIISTIMPKLIEIFSASLLLSRNYGFEVGLSLMVMLGAYSAYSLSQVKTLVDNRELSLQKNNESWAELEGAIKNYKVIHDYNQLDYTLDKLHQSQIDFIKHYIKAENFPQKIAFRQTLMVRAYMAICTLYVASQIQSGQVSPSSFIMLLGYLNQLSTSLPEFSEALNSVLAAIPDLKFVFSELDKGPEIIEKTKETAQVMEMTTSPEINFSNVSFSYPKSERNPLEAPLFSNMTFTINPGEFVAIVSESGVGKTTLFNLLYGHYQPLNGQITINHQLIDDVTRTSWQKNIALFSQSPDLFKGTVRENIAYGSNNPNAVSDEMIWQQAKLAHLNHFLEQLPKGLDTEVGDNGKALSGGQQQKVGILRGMMKQSAIRLLDEITASCDSQSAKQVMSAIANSREGTTTLMITHKLSEVHYADRILVVGKNGLIAEGKHDELVNHCPLYKSLCQSYQSTDQSQFNPGFFELPKPRPLITTASSKKEREQENGMPVSIL